MNIVFFSTNTNKFDPSKFCITEYPDPSCNWKILTQAYEGHEFKAAANLPAMFLASYKDGLAEEQKLKECNVNFISLDKNAFTGNPGEEEKFIEQTVEKILSLNPQLAIAASYWVSPYDWSCCMDSLIGQRLRSKGIKVLCNSLDTSLTCFNKAQTIELLRHKGFNVANSVYVHHDLFFKTKSNVEINPYRHAVLEQIKGLNFPVIVKDTTGSSSVGLDVMQEYSQVEQYLFSKRNSSDRLIEEFLEGPQFGLEIRGTADSYRVLPPFIFSVNRYGITSPKQSVKLGPITHQKYRIDELKTQMKELARLLKIHGTAQIDLVFHKQKWYIIEINPRLSGMSNTYAASCKKTVLESLTQLALEGTDTLPQDDKMQCTLNIKLPLLTDQQFEAIKNAEGTAYICQTQNLAATQHRERGYTEIIFTAPDFKKLESLLKNFNRDYPESMEGLFYEKALDLLQDITRSQ